MKALIVYYSLEGNTKDTAEKIARKTGADLLCLEPVKAYPSTGPAKYIQGGLAVISGAKPPLKPYICNLKDYDTVIIGSPIWAGTYAPPIRSFLAEHSLAGKHLAFFACSKSGSADKYFANLQKGLGSAPVAELSLIDPFQSPAPENEAKISAFCDAINALN